MPARQTGAAGNCRGMEGQERADEAEEEEGPALIKKYCIMGKGK